MLSAFSRNKKEKLSTKAEANIKKGALLLKGKLYKQAVLELKMALDLDKETTTQNLQAMLSDFVKARELEASMSVGLVLLQVKTKDYELANRIGNIARKLHNYKQANNLYKQALRINKNFIKAYYNLAASMGKVDKYDMDVKKSIETFANYSDFVLPEYQNDQKIVNEILEQWEEKAEEDREDILEVRKKIATYLKQAIKENWKKHSITDGKTILQGDIYNLGLFTLSYNDAETAMENFIKLKSQNSQLPHLDMLVAITRSKMKNTRRAIEEIVALLGSNQFDRYLNINLGLLYQKLKNRLLSYKYLSVSAVLLEKSEGQFSHSNILIAADDHFENGNFKKALHLYKLVADEIPDIRAMTQIGEIHILNNNFPEAVIAFKKLVELEPDSQFAKQKLRDIHDHYIEKADDLIKDKKIAQGIVLFERALTIERVPETIEKTAKIYIRIRDNEKASVLMEEFEEIKKKELQLRKEKDREIHVIKAKAYMKKKDFTKAIESFEMAFKIRKDKDVFVYLAHIYKGLKRTNALNHLIHRWQEKMERMEKDERQKKEQDRAKEESEEAEISE